MATKQVSAESETSLRSMMQDRIFAKRKEFTNRDVMEALKLEDNAIHNVRRITRGLVAEGALKVVRTEARRVEVYAPAGKKGKEACMEPVRRGREPQPQPKVKEAPKASRSPRKAKAKKVVAQPTA